MIPDVQFDHAAAHDAAMWCRRRAVLMEDAAAELAGRDQGLVWVGPAAREHRQVVDHQVTRLVGLAAQLRALAGRIERGAEEARVEQGRRERRREQLRAEQDRADAARAAAAAAAAPGTSTPHAATGPR